MDPNNQQLPATPQKSSKSGWVATFSVAGFILLALGVIIFLYNQNQSLKEMLVGNQVTPTPETFVTPSPTPSTGQPVVSNPIANSKIKSPLKVTGTVPSGWMSEGVFPIRLLDSDGSVIAQIQAKESTPGAWQSGNPVDFTATLTFKIASGSGTLVLENDNPSGNPANSKAFEIPISF